MQWRLSLGAAFNLLHQDSIEGGRRRKKRMAPGDFFVFRGRRHLRLFDAFDGELSGLNFNGVPVLDLLSRGPRVSYSRAL